MPIQGDPDPEWVKAFAHAMPEQRPGDERWKHAAGAVTVDSVKGVRHIVFITSGVEAADFVMTYLTAIDGAIEAANASVTD